MNPGHRGPFENCRSACGFSDICPRCPAAPVSARGNAIDRARGVSADRCLRPWRSGAGSDYGIVAPDAGTYWYHAHNKSVEQVARRLYGPLIVEDPQAPDVDQDLTLMLGDWRPDPETVQITGDFDNGHDLSHAGLPGNLVTDHGGFDPAHIVKRHERLRGA